MILRYLGWELMNECEVENRVVVKRVVENGVDIKIENE
jgi:hypothetical protein